MSDNYYPGEIYTPSTKSPKVIHIPSATLPGGQRTPEEALDRDMWPLVDVGMPPEGHCHLYVTVLAPDGPTSYDVIVDPAEDGSRYVSEAGIRAAILPAYHNNAGLSAEPETPIS